MRLQRVSFRGLTVFPNPVTMDLDAAGGHLVALVGPNGAGKSTAMEAVVACLYKTLPSRPGSLYDYAHGRDAFIEAVFDDTFEQCTVRLSIDAEARKMESYIFGNGGVSLTTGRAKEFEETVVRRFGTYDLLMASAFCAQNRAGNFLLMPKAGRKALFAELLRLGRLVTMCEKTVAHRNAALGLLIVARGMLGAKREEQAGLAGAHYALEAQDGIVAEAEIRHAEARTAVADAILAGEQAKAACGALGPLNAALETARAAEDAAAASARRAGRLPEEARARANAADAAATRRDIDREEREANAEIRRRRAYLDGRTKELNDLLAAAPAVAGAVAAEPALEVEVAVLAGAAARLTESGATFAGAERTLHQARNRHADATASLDRERKALDDKTALMGRVPCTETDQWTALPTTVCPPTPTAGWPVRVTDLAARCPLLADARGARARIYTLSMDPAILHDVQVAEAALAEADGALQAAAGQCNPERLRQAEALLASARRLTARREALERAQEELDGLKTQREEAETHHAAVLELLQLARDERTVILGSIHETLADDLAKAQVEIDAALVRLHETERAEIKAAAALDAHVLPDMTVVEQELNNATAEASLREDHLRQARASRERKAVAVERLDTLTAEIDTKEREVQHGEEEVAQWTLLEQALGKDGIQAYEIDAAGPEVAAITNELLEAYPGRPFTVSFETLREKKSAPGEYAEAFDVKVYDRGQERTIEALSGGERVVVGEAIGLALAIFNARKGGLKWRTLFRDETAGALDPANAQAYVDMLRRALGLGGFEQVVFVAHQPEVYERADVRLFVGGGRITTE